MSKRVGMGVENRLIMIGGKCAASMQERKTFAMWSARALHVEEPSRLVLGRLSAAAEPAPPLLLVQIQFNLLNLSRRPSFMQQLQQHLAARPAPLLCHASFMQPQQHLADAPDLLRGSHCVFEG